MASSANRERIEAVDERGTSRSQFDARGRLLRLQDADGGVIEYRHDAVGNLLERRSPSQTLLYRYDARNRLIEVERRVQGEAPALTRYSYDAAGRRSVMEGGDGTRTEYAYDSRHRLRGLVKRSALGALLIGMGYQVDADGLRTQISESDATGLVRTVQYDYDAVKRLVAERIDHRIDLQDRQASWSYDRVGNRLRQSVEAGAAAEVIDYTYDINDRLQSERGASIADYAYDAAGNLLSHGTPGGITEYAYNDAGRMREARSAGEVNAYVYNADGLRVRHTQNPAGGTPEQALTTWSLQDPTYAYAQEIERWTSTGSAPRRRSAVYSFADDLISQTRYDAADTASTNYVQADGFGSTRWLTDATGAITDQIDYDAFGNEIARSGSTAIEHLYRGERWDAHIAAYDLRARLYTPSNGRFLTQDTFAGFNQDPQSLHKYVYTHNNPVNNTDPSGHFSVAEVGTSLRVMGHLAAIGIPTYNAVSNLRAGVSIGETSIRFAAEVTIGYAGGAVIGRLFRFLPPIVKIRPAGSLGPAGGRAPGSIWNMGIHPRGEAVEKAILGGPRALPWNYPVIDDFAGGFATSIKSMDLIGKSPAYIRSQIMRSAEQLNSFVPRNWGSANLLGRPVNGRNLIYAFEAGGADAAQAALLRQVAQEVRVAYPHVKIAFQWIP